MTTLESHEHSLIRQYNALDGTESAEYHDALLEEIALVQCSQAWTPPLCPHCGQATMGRDDAGEVPGRCSACGMEFETAPRAALAKAEGRAS